MHQGTNVPFHFIDDVPFGFGIPVILVDRRHTKEFAHFVIRKLVCVLLYNPSIIHAHSVPTKRNQAIMLSSTVLECDSITNNNNNNNNTKVDADGCLCVASAAAVGVEHDEEDDKQAREIHDTLLR